MAFLIFIPVFLLPLFLIFWFIYQRVFEDNLLLLWMALLIGILATLIFLFNHFKWDEMLTMHTSKYALRFNDERQQNHLPLLTTEFTEAGLTWNTKLDSVSNKSKFVLLQKVIEENDQHNGAEQEFNFLGKALSDSTVLYLRIQYNFLTTNYYAETRIGNLSRPSYTINRLQVYDDCCSKPYTKRQVDSLLIE